MLHVKDVLAGQTSNLKLESNIALYATSDFAFTDPNKSTSNLPPATFVVLANSQLTKDTDGEIFENIHNENKALNSLPTLQYPSDPSDPSLGITYARKPIGPISAVFFAGGMTQFGGARDTNEQSNIFGWFPSTYQGGDQLRNVPALYDP
jgi:hypothetical protein